jgi:hypothetical protein
MKPRDVLEKIVAIQHPTKIDLSLEAIGLSDADRVGCKIILDLADQNYTVGEVLKILDAARWWTILWASVEKDTHKE